MGGIRMTEKNQEFCHFSSDSSPDEHTTTLGTWKKGILVKVNDDILKELSSSQARTKLLEELIEMMDEYEIEDTIEELELTLKERNAKWGFWEW